MSGFSTLSIIVLLIAGAACAAAVWAFIELARTMRSVRALSDDAARKLPPLVDKIDVTVDAVNAELLRIDGIITKFEDAGERVSSASGTIHDIVNAPTEIVTGVAARVRNAWRERKHAPSEPQGRTHGGAGVGDPGYGAGDQGHDTSDDAAITPQEATDDR